jgi:hypothetical protein
MNRSALPSQVVLQRIKEVLGTVVHSLLIWPRHQQQVKTHNLWLGIHEKIVSEISSVQHY